MATASPLIALVENDLPVNRALSRLLRAHGYGVQSFVSAELLLARPVHMVFDCLLLDIDLDGMSGLDLQQLLRDRGDRTPIIFLTGSADARVGAVAQQLGCSAFLYKPVTATLLVDAITQALIPNPAG